jgi:hypothetical protein
MRVRLLLTVFTSLVLTGCGLTGVGAPSPHTPDPLPGTIQPQPSAAPTDLPFLASRLTSDGPFALDVAVREVRTGAAAMTVTISVTNRSTLTRAWIVGDFFDDGTTTGPTDGGWTAGGIAVIDTSAAKRYLPARTADGTCMSVSYTHLTLPTN